MTTLTITIPETIAGYLYDLCNTETAFWLDVIGDVRRKDEHESARQAITDWRETKKQLVTAGADKVLV